ncbi:Solute carrier family 35 member F2-like protein [Drosera capensis]
MANEERISWWKKQEGRFGIVSVFIQYVGSAACILGLGLVFLSDAGIDDGSAGTKPLLGDILVVAGTLFDAFSNIGEEYCVKKKDLVEVVTMLSTFGTLLSGATLFHLSTLTSDMWAVVIRIFFYHQTVDWLYYLSFAIVVVGLIIYSQTYVLYLRSVPNILGSQTSDLRIRREAGVLRGYLRLKSLSVGWMLSTFSTLMLFKSREKDRAPTTSIEDENHTNGDYQALPEEIPASRDEDVVA